VKHIVSVSLLSLVSSLAMAESAPEAAATPAPEAAAPVASEDTTKVSMRVQLDPFYKDLNNANKNYKTPKLDTLRVMFDRKLGSNGKVDAEFRLNELEKAPATGISVNSNVLKYYHILFNVPGVDGLEVGYVREYDPALYGLTEKAKSSNLATGLSLTGHMNRIEGYRAKYELHDEMHTTLTYHLARNDELSDTTLGTKQTDRTWYHKLTADTKVGDTKVQLGYGMQGKFLQDGEKTSRKNDSFIHLQAKHKMDDLELKGGVAYDTYAVTKGTGTGNDVVTTALVAAKYDLMPKEFAVIGEFDLQMLKAADKTVTDFSSDENSKATDKASTMVFTLAGQYMLDSKLSVLPSYQYWNSDVANDKDDKALKGSDGKASKTHQALGLRIRYDY
jgi:hypothetical protein